MANIALIDTNVLLDVFMHRGAFYDASYEILTRCAKGEFSGYVAFHTISNVWYILGIRRKRSAGKCCGKSVTCRK